MIKQLIKKWLDLEPKPIEVKILKADALEYYPSYAKPGDSGMDVKFVGLDEFVDIKPWTRMLIPTGIYVEIPKGYEIQVRPKSGVALTNGVTVLNTPGTIDSSYRGEIGVILMNLSDRPYRVNRYDKVAQLVLCKVEECKWTPVSVISNTERGEGGYGHTGIK